MHCNSVQAFFSGHPVCKGAGTVMCYHVLYSLPSAGIN